MNGKKFGGTTTEGANTIKQTRDGGYVVAGYSLSNDGDVKGNHGYFDYWVVKVDSIGTIEHQVSLGETNDDNAKSVEQTADGGYIVAGKAIVAGGHGAHDFWIVKLFADLTIDWQKSLGGSSSDEASSVQQTTDGGYIVAGSSSSNDGDVTVNKGFTDYWIVKLDASGNITWQKSYGGTGSDRASMIRQTADGGYIVAGTSDSDDNDITASNGSMDYWVVKLNNEGDKVWQKSLGGSMDEEATSIRQAFDGGYIVAGISNSDDGDVLGNHKKDYSGTLYTTIDYWIVKLNSDGTIAHKTSLGGSGEDHANSIAQATDDGYIVTGYSKSIDGDVQGNLNNNSVYEDAWVVKLNATLGLIEWQKTFGGSKSDNALSVEQTSDNGYIAAGASYSNNGDVAGNHGEQDFWLLKLYTDVITTSLANTTTTVVKNITENITNEVTTVFLS